MNWYETLTGWFEEITYAPSTSNVVSQSFLSKIPEGLKTQDLTITRGSQTMAKPQESQWFHKTSTSNPQPHSQHMKPQPLFPEYFHLYIVLSSMEYSTTHIFHVSTP